MAGSGFEAKTGSMRYRLPRPQIFKYRLQQARRDQKRQACQLWRQL